MHTRFAAIGRVAVLLAVGCLLVGYAPNSEAAGKVRRREVVVVPLAASAQGKEHTIHGKLVSVSGRSITVAIKHKEKSKDRTFEITRHTKIKGAKGEAGLKSGEHVVVHAKGKHAEEITVHEHHKKKKKA
jgi:hypothetical protein